MKNAKCKRIRNEYSNNNNNNINILHAQLQYEKRFVSASFFCQFFYFSIFRTRTRRARTGKVQRLISRTAYGNELSRTELKELRRVSNRPKRGKEGEKVEKVYLKLLCMHYFVYMPKKQLEFCKAKGNCMGGVGEIYII